MNAVHDRSSLDDRARREPSSVHRIRKNCRACGNEHLERFLKLGDQPLANSFLNRESEFEGEPRFPLDVYFCRTCFLVQLADVIDPDILFSNYLYVTGTSETIAAHNQAYARTVVDLLQLGASDRVLEVASNDGSLLKCFRALGVPTLGVEPAANIAQQARADGIDTLPVFFDERTADLILDSHGPAKAVIGNNVLAHVDDTHGFLTGARKLLAPGGRVIVEVPYLGTLMERLEYDTIYHEHLCYFSVAALAELCERAGLTIDRVDDLAIHGGTIRVYAASAEEIPGHAPAVLARIEEERSRGFMDPGSYFELADAAAAQREQLRSLLQDLKADGKTVAGYGASAKGSTLLNFCGIDASLLDFIADKSPLKVGRYAPGSHVPVVPATAVLERQPDYLLILAWNFADEIMRQQAEYQRRGGAFIIPIPAPEVVR